MEEGAGLLAFVAIVAFIWIIPVMILRKMGKTPESFGWFIWLMGLGWFLVIAAGLGAGD